jgi:hypothetical protein
VRSLSIFGRILQKGSIVLISLCLFIISCDKTKVEFTDLSGVPTPPADEQESISKLLSKITLSTSSFEVLQKETLQVVLIFSEAFPTDITMQWKLTGADLEYFEVNSGTVIIPKGESASLFKLKPKDSNPPFADRTYSLALIPDNEHLKLTNLTIKLIDNRNQNSSISPEPSATPSASTTNITNQATPPSIAINLPLNNIIVNSSNLALTGTCSTSEANQSVSIKVNGITNGTGGTCVNSAFAAIIDLINLNQGSNSLVANIQSTAGINGQSNAVIFFKDTQAPTNVIFINPNVSTYFSNAFEFSWTTGTDSGGSGIKDYIYTLYESNNCSNSPITTGTLISPSSLTYLLQNPTSNASYTLSVIVRDNAGNQSPLICSPAATEEAPPTISIGPTQGTEGSSLLFQVQLNKSYSKEVTFLWSTGTSGTAVSDIDFTSNTLTVGTIDAGSLNTTLVVSTYQDNIYEGPETFNVTISTPINAHLETVTTATGTIIDDDLLLGDFQIQNITGANDSIADNYLSNGITPTLTWSPSSNSTSYDVTIFQSDAITVVCATQNTTSTTLAMLSSCQLTPGSSYLVSINSKYNLQTHPATNNMFSLIVNQSPAFGSGGDGFWYVLSGGTLNINAQWLASPSVGIAVDPEGDALTLTTVGSGALGTTLKTSSTLTYVPNAGKYGNDLVAFTIADSKGGLLSGNVKIKVVSPYTWVGNNSSSWSTGSNWCGTISADKKSCAGASVKPANADIIVFSDACSSSFTCSPTTDSIVSVKGVNISANGFTQGTSFTLTIGTTGWTQSGGQFNGGNSLIDLGLSEFNLSGGVFYSTSGDFKVRYTKGGYATYNMFMVTNPNSFFHNLGRVWFYVYSSNYPIFNIRMASNNNFNNVLVSLEGAAMTDDVLLSTATSPSRVVVEGNLDLKNVAISGQWEVQGNLTFGSGYGSYLGAESAALFFTGSKNQTINNNVNALFCKGNITIDKSNGSLDLLSNVTLNGTNQNVTVTNGSINMNGNNFTIPKTLTMSANSSITMSGGTLSYTTWNNLGTINP